VADTIAGAPSHNGKRCQQRAPEVLEYMSRKVKGMVALEGVTYRIVRVAQGSYSVVRIRDDQEVGSFKTAPALGIEARLVEPALLREVARLAIHTAKTSYVGFPAPVAPAPGASSGLHRRSSTPPPFPAT
jgi:hypothetical protein